MSANRKIVSYMPAYQIQRCRCVPGCLCEVLKPAKRTIRAPGKEIRSKFCLSGTSPCIGVYKSFLNFANQKFRQGFSRPEDTRQKDPRTARERVFRVYRRKNMHLNGDVLVGIGPTWFDGWYMWRERPEIEHKER
ncbi:hypothetical protein C8R43DRAFT_1112852 [Mycena crocata]|nr:hypothetical protein C8R43DRAFT_1112852 [Mycena crocata]